MLWGVLVPIGVLIAVGWFAVGWIARGHENRKYAESRLQSLATRAAAEQLHQATWVDAQRAPTEPLPAITAPTVIYVQAPPIAAPIWPQAPIANQHIPMIEGGTYDQD